jgi:3-carboxy-cis,cis-muconate cycloisomerase
MSAVFSAPAFVQAMVRVETAFTRAAAGVGLVSQTIADEIASHLFGVQLDAEQILREGWERGTPVLVLLDELRRGLSAEAGAALHLGVTTQDVVDSAVQLQIGDGIQLLVGDLRHACVGLAELAAQHRSVPMVARTFLQHAGTTTFGLRAALWLEPLAAHQRELAAAHATRPIQLGGPVGLLDGFGDHGIAVMAAAATELSLAAPVTPWHGDRDPIHRVVDLVARVAASVAKIATDISVLCSTEISELRVRAGGSSSISGKANPIDAIRSLAAAAACTGAAQTLRSAPAVELERGVGGWHAEWFTVPLVFMTAAAAVEAIGRSVTSISVNDDAMRRNLAGVNADSAKAVICAGRLIDRILSGAAEAANKEVRS